MKDKIAFDNILKHAFELRNKLKSVLSRIVINYRCIREGNRNHERQEKGSYLIRKNKRNRIY